MDHEPSAPPWPPRPPPGWPEFLHPAPATIAAIALVLGIVYLLLEILWQLLQRRLAIARRGVFVLDAQSQQEQGLEPRRRNDTKPLLHHPYPTHQSTTASSSSSTPPPATASSLSSSTPSRKSKKKSKSKSKCRPNKKKQPRLRPTSEVEIEARQLLFHDTADMGERLPLRDPNARGSLYNTFQIPHPHATRLKHSQSMMELNGGDPLDGTDKAQLKKAKTIHWHGVNRLNTAWAWMS